MRRFWEWIKCLFRKERRVKNGATRGRIYQKVNPTEIEVEVPVNEGGIVFMKKAKVSFDAKVVRADGTVEPIDPADITLAAELANRRLL